MSEVQRYTPIRGMFDCLLGGDYVTYADYAALTAKYEAERAAREAAELWRGRWIDSRTTDIRRIHGWDYERARAEAEYDANQYDAEYKAARERLENRDAAMKGSQP